MLIYGAVDEGGMIHPWNIIVCRNISKAYNIIRDSNQIWCNHNHKKRKDSLETLVVVS